MASYTWPPEGSGGGGSGNLSGTWSSTGNIVTTDGVATAQDSGVAISALAPADHLNNAGNSGTTKTLDFSTGNGQQVTMTGNCTFTLSNGTAGRSYLMYVLGGTGGFTISVGATTWLNSSAAPPGAPTASSVLLINFYCLDGTNYLGSFAGNY